METFINALKKLNTCDLGNFMPVFADEHHMGFIHKNHVSHLVHVHPALVIESHRIHIKSGDSQPASLTAIFKQINQKLVAQGILYPHHLGEVYRIVTDDFRQPICYMERYAGTFWGVQVFGVYVNGLVKKEDGLHMWVAQRAMTQKAEPGKFDAIVCGGQPGDISIQQNLYKEAAEEANIPQSFLEKEAIPVGSIACSFAKNNEFRRYVGFVYDLYLPQTFVPKNNDGAVGAFFCVPLKIMLAHPEKIYDFKSSVQVLILNLLLRHGYIQPDQPGYLNLNALLTKGFFSGTPCV